MKKTKEPRLLNEIQMYHVLNWLFTELKRPIDVECRSERAKRDIESLIYSIVMKMEYKKD